MTSRRSFIIGSLSIAGAALGYGLYREDAFLRDLLHEMLGPFEISDEDFVAFKGQFLKRLGRPRKYYGSYLVWSSDGVIPVPAGALERYDSFKRKLITDFVLSTRWLDSEDKKLKFYGFGMPCYNPFADLTY